ncbi:hypothetical protein [Prauserella cavernicola]|uniref:Uncharacterized protein n=1 Tax=Prauserella cavernicola TaxID=2800127 RepID=A0A934QZP3_9PSEU|nr:hypothetical protein [Prauserella cavernicola]MBK1789366.1 hypothetical protein [Prauserella cavernicola]
MSDEILADDLVDDEYLREFFREPRRYLPPPGTRDERMDEPPPPPEPERPFARRAKLAALLLALALLGTSIVVAASIASDHDQSSGDDVGEPLEITGAAALGGFALPAKSTAGKAVVDDAAPAVAGAPATAGAVRQVAQRDDAGEGSQTGEADTSAQGRVGTVREFYERVDTSPDDAVELLGPSLAAERESLVEAWRSMDSVEVEDLREERDGSVLAVVTMVPERGTPLRVTQQLGVDAGPSGRINDAKLLSAQPN